MQIGFKKACFLKREMFPKEVDRLIAEYANPIPNIRGYRELGSLQWIIWTYVGAYEDCRCGLLQNIMAKALFGEPVFVPPCELEVIHEEISIFGHVGLTGSDILHARRMTKLLQRGFCGIRMWPPVFEHYHLLRPS